MRPTIMLALLLGCNPEVPNERQALEPVNAAGTNTGDADADADADSDADTDADTDSDTDADSDTDTDADTDSDTDTDGTGDSGDTDDTGGTHTGDTGPVDPTWYYDADGDGWGDRDEAYVGASAPIGYVAEQDADGDGVPDFDCNDDPTGDDTGDPDATPASAINPGAVEVCDPYLVDENCNGLADDADTITPPSNTSAWFPDADSDGFADVAILPVNQCLAPAGHIGPTSHDCDDADAAVHPDATETCNGVDDDCANGVDDGLQQTWFQDSDSDGWGDSSVSEVECDGRQSAGFVEGDVDGDGVNDFDCDDGDPNYQDDVTYCLDADGDGYSDETVCYSDCADPAPSFIVPSADPDCDDLDSSTNPGALEFCDGLDNDCDGDVDEGLTCGTGGDSGDTGDSGLDTGSMDTGLVIVTWYLDADGDGHGDPATTFDSDTAPPQYVAVGDDCDDDDAAVHPGAQEVCDDGNVDEDCNGLADDDDSDATGLKVWFADADGDTYGNAADSLVQCDQPPGYVHNEATDCDDSVFAVNPGATEVCDGIDNDCTNGADTELKEDWFEDDDGDGYGNAAVHEFECDGQQSAGYVRDDTDCDDTEPLFHEEVAYCYDGDGDGYGDDDTKYSDCAAPAPGYTATCGDCDDDDALVNPAIAEICGNGIDDDCSADPDSGNDGIDDGVCDTGDSGGSGDTGDSGGGDADTDTDSDSDADADSDSDSDADADTDTDTDTDVDTGGDSGDTGVVLTNHIECTEQDTNTYEIVITFEDILSRVSLADVAWLEFYKSDDGTSNGLQAYAGDGNSNAAHPATMPNVGWYVVAINAAETSSEQVDLTGMTADETFCSLDTGSDTGIAAFANSVLYVGPN